MGAGLCVGVPEPHISAFCFFLLCLQLPYHVVRITQSIQLSSSLLNGSHRTTAVAQQARADHYLWLLCACVDIAYACVLCAMGVCVGVCGSADLFVCWHPKFHLSFLFCLLCMPLAAAAVSCRLYHTVPQALELSTLWQPRYNSSRTASVCGPLPRVCWHLHMRV